MTLEDYIIEKARKKFPHWGHVRALDIWRWHGQPGFLYEGATVPKPLDIFVGRMVLAAPEEQCLFSPSQYVRELKKWFGEVDKSEYQILLQPYNVGFKWLGLLNTYLWNKIVARNAYSWHNWKYVMRGRELDIDGWKLLMGVPIEKVAKIPDFKS